MKPKFFFALLALTLCSAALFGQVGGQVGQVSLSQYASKNDGATAFKSGDFIYAHVKLSKPLADLVTVEDGKPVTLSIEILENGKSIERDDFPLDAKQVKGKMAAEFVLPMISNPTVPCESFGKYHYATYLPKAFAKFSAGTHELECRVNCYAYKGGKEPLASVKFSLAVESDAKAFYEKNAKEVYNEMVKGIAPPSQAEVDAANAKMKAMPSGDMDDKYFKVSFKNITSKVLNIWLDDRQSPLNVNPGATTTERIKKGRTVNVFVGEPHKAQDRKVTTITEKDAGKTIPINYIY
ncbi:MAG: hypothetical protein SNJ55_05080 [Chloroherpetonaceae bacterium]